MTLPRPVTIDQHYLAAILAELRGLRADMAAQATAVSGPPPGELVELREPALTPLPADFPGAEALTAAGVGYFELVPRDGDTLVAIPGIGKATAGRILTRLA
jgi:hypothetical protein